MMKDGVRQIVGKSISGVVVAETPRALRRQVFLVFTDNTHFEFWGDSLTGAGGVDTGGLEEVGNYIAKCGAKVTMEVSESKQTFSSAVSKAVKANNFPRYCIFLVFFECLVGSLSLFLDHGSAGGLVLAIILAGMSYYIFEYQISRF
jgi:hypothetical protein